MFNLKYGNNNSDPVIIDLLKKYDLYNYFSNFEKGINSLCGVNGSNLSMGMQKIIMVIRGILKRRNIILFDEPLTSLDEESKQKIIKILLNEIRDRTFIIITHDSMILKHTKNIIYL